MLFFAYDKNTNFKDKFWNSGKLVLFYKKNDKFWKENLQTIICKITEIKNSLTNLLNNRIFTSTY